MLINENRLRRYQIKVIKFYFLLFYTIIYTILHITDESLVPVLRNKALKFRCYMYLKEGLFTISAQNLKKNFAIEFFAVETLPQNFSKNSTPQKNPVIR